MPVDEEFVAQNPFTFDAACTRAVRTPMRERLGRGPGLRDLARTALGRRWDRRRRLEDDRGPAPGAFPEARVLIVIREQRSMLLSIHKTQIRWATGTIEERWRDRTVIERRRPGPTLDYFRYDL